jgi:hypothetical protein
MRKTLFHHGWDRTGLCATAQALCWECRVRRPCRPISTHLGSITDWRETPAKSWPIWRGGAQQVPLSTAPCMDPTLTQTDSQLGIPSHHACGGARTHSHACVIDGGYVHPLSYSCVCAHSAHTAREDFAEARVCPLPPRVWWGPHAQSRVRHRWRVCTSTFLQLRLCSLRSHSP